MSAENNNLIQLYSLTDLIQVLFEYNKYINDDLDQSCVLINECYLPSQNTDSNDNLIDEYDSENDDDNQDLWNIYSQHEVDQVYQEYQSYQEYLNNLVNTDFYKSYSQNNDSTDDKVIFF